jgi:hypothetical protein
MFANQPANISDFQSESLKSAQPLAYDTSWLKSPHQFLASTSSFGKSADISLDSLDRLVGSGSDLSPGFFKPTRKNSKHYESTDNSKKNDNTSDASPNSKTKCSCKDAMEHIDNCDKCSGRLKSMIKNAVSKTMDDALLDHKLKVLQQPLQQMQLQPALQQSLQSQIVQPFTQVAATPVQQAQILPTQPTPTAPVQIESKKSSSKGYTTRDVVLIVCAILIIVLLLFLVFRKK